MTPEDIILKKIAKKLHDHPEKLKDINAAVAIHLTGDDGGRWVIDCTREPAQINKDEKAPVNMTICMKSSDFVKMTKGELNPQMAFLFGKIKIEGDLGLAMKLGGLLT
jgi:putative sterol carrier protein